MFVNCFAKREIVLIFLFFNLSFLKRVETVSFNLIYRENVSNSLLYFNVKYITIEIIYIFDNNDRNFVSERKEPIERSIISVELSCYAQSIR